jgi:hypothetical protein
MGGKRKERKERKKERKTLVRIAGFIASSRTVNEVE